MGNPLPLGGGASLEQITVDATLTTGGSWTSSGGDYYQDLDTGLTAADYPLETTLITIDKHFNHAWESIMWEIIDDTTLKVRVWCNVNTWPTVAVKIQITGGLDFVQYMDFLKTPGGTLRVTAIQQTVTSITDWDDGKLHILAFECGSANKGRYNGGSGYRYGVSDMEMVSATTLQFEGWINSNASQWFSFVAYRY